MSKMKDIKVLQRGINFSAHNAGSMFGPPKEVLERYVFELNSIEKYSKTHKRFLYASFLLLLVLPPIGILMLIAAYFLSRAKKGRMQARVNEVTERNLPRLEQYFVLKKTSLGFYSLKGGSAEVSMKNVMVPVVMPGLKPFMIHLDDISKLDEMFPPPPNPINSQPQIPDQANLLVPPAQIQFPAPLPPGQSFAAPQVIYQPQVVQGALSQAQTSFLATSFAPPQNLFLAPPDALPGFFAGKSPDSKASIMMRTTQPVQAQPANAPITVADLRYLTSDRRVLRQDPRILLRDSAGSNPRSLSTAEETTLLFSSSKALHPNVPLPLRQSSQATA